MARATERVEGADLIGSERARVGMYFGMIAIRERVLAIQLDLVHLPGCEPVDERVERVHRRDLVARYVEHDAADREIGMVADHADRQPTAVQARELGDGGATIEASGLVAADQRYAVVADRQRVALRRQRRVDALSHGGVRGEAFLDVKEPRLRQQVHDSALR